MSTSFEDCLKGLEKAAEELKKEDITLEQALASYEEGIRCYNECSEILENAKQKIEVLKRKA